MPTFARHALASGALLFTACSNAGSGAIPWAGDEPHLIVRGTIDGEDIDIDLRGADALAGMISCEREYETLESSTTPGTPDLTTPSSTRRRSTSS